MRKFSISFLHRSTGNHWKKKREYRYIWQTCLLFTSDRGELTNIHHRPPKEKDSTLTRPYADVFSRLQKC